MRYPGLREAARRRWEKLHAGKTRVVVQVGHCSQAVGAEEVASSFEDTFMGNPHVSIPGASSPGIDLAIAGCDGACFNAPQVIITGPTGTARRFGRMTPTGARDLADDLIREYAPPLRVGYTPAGSPISSLADGVTDGVEEFFSNQRRLVLERLGQIDPTDIDEYISVGGYEGAHRALSMPPEEVIQTVEQAGLLGRGGAYFPAARKWQSARSASGASPGRSNVTSRYLVVNCEEGEPGLFKDRHIMEGEPHRLLEGAIIAAYASGVEKCYIYINAEADLSSERVEKALDQARELNLIGDNILESGFSLQVEVRRGAGGYVCGEETTLLNTIEGERRAPRLRPPFPTEAGLWARPTVINNAETLSNLPLIMAGDHQRSRFTEAGTDSARGTKLVCLSGSLRRPGLAEVPMGTTLRHVIYDIGGGPLAGHMITAIAVGGPSSGLLPVSMPAYMDVIDAPILPGTIHESGVVIGAGGIIAIDERTPILEAVRKLASYNAAESCGKCTPCREGTPRMVDVLNRLIAGHGRPADLDELSYLAEVIGAASLCGLGQMAGGPINSALHFFRDEMVGVT